jgi:hypothetical protein
MAYAFGFAAIGTLLYHAAVQQRKSQIPSSKLQINYKSQSSNIKHIVRFEILNLDIGYYLEIGNWKLEIPDVIHRHPYLRYVA